MTDQPPESHRSDHSAEATDPEPTPSEIERMGELSAALSDLSINIEQDDYPGKTRSRGLAGLFQVIRPMIHGPVMWFFAIANVILSILIFFLIIYLIVFVILLSSSTDQEKRLDDKIDAVKYCSVSWHPLTACPAKCTEGGSSAGNYSERISYIDDVVTDKKWCPSYLVDQTVEHLKGLTNNVPCNVWACK